MPMPRVQKHRAKSVSLPAPSGGWNTRDALGAMPATDAVELVNFVPRTTMCELRFGYSRWATGMSGQVETLMAYEGGATSRLFAAVSQVGTDSIYNVSASGAVGAAVVTGLTNARWQHVNIATVGGSYLICANGADDVRSFDGTVWATPSITGVTSANLVHVNIFKNRLWFIETNTLRAWYLGTQAISGAASALDMRAYAPHGGFLQAMGTWTIDAGYGVDDHAVFITSEGDVLVYRGTDPSSASTWALVGAWWIGSPVGRRCLMKYRGDLLVITQDGVLPLSGALQSSRVNPRVAVTDKIQPTIAAAIELYGSAFGWQLVPYPRESLLLLNVPVTVGEQEQYVMNMITGSWGRFQGWNANCWELYGDEIYFGSENFVGRAWNTNADDGVAIDTRALQAFNYFGSGGQLKRFTLMRPTLLTNGSPSIQGTMNVDFSTADPTSALATVAVVGGTWGSAVWNTGLWGADLSLSAVWQGTTGVGYCGAPRLASQTNGLQLQWIVTEVVMEPGAVI